MKKNLSSPSALRISTLVAAISLALLTACSDKQPAAQADASASNTPAAATAETNNKSGEKSDNGAAADASEKIQAYIKCYNSVDGRADDAIERYASWIKDMKVGPTGNEKNVYGLYELHENSVQSCKKSLTAAIAQKPAMEALDNAAQSYLDTLLVLAERANEANTYYERENYKDDGFAKGKQMHGPLAQAMENFSKASKAFSDALETENDKLLAEELKQVEQAEGRKLRYWRMVTMAEAKQLTSLIAEESFDLDKATAALAEFEQAADGLVAYAKDHKDELPTAWSLMDSSVEDFRIAAKERIRRVRDKKPYTHTERNWVGTNSGWMVEGSPDKLIRQYNGLVNRSNSTR